MAVVARLTGDLGPDRARSRPAGSFNALFTHRVRVTSSDDLDDTLAGWLAAAYASAG